MKTTLATLFGIALVSPLTLAQSLYLESFPHPGGGDLPISTAGWADDVPGGDRLYDNGGGDGAAWSWNGSANTEALYTTTALDSGATGMAFPSIDPASNPGLTLSVDLLSTFAPELVEARFAVLVGGSWYTAASPLATPTGAWETQTMAFDPTAALWNELTVSGDGSGTGATIGATAATDLSGMITGAGMVFTRSGSATHDFDNFAIVVPEPSTWATMGMGALLLVRLVFRRRA
jgi:hypothetical protein